MSEVKLYRLFPKYGGPSYGPMVPATTAEIMDAHPKCGECRHSDTHEHYGTTDCIVDQRYIRGVNKDKDYCRHWEAKG